MGDFIEGEFTTVRTGGEILRDIQVPRPVARARFAYHSFGHLERPAVGVAIAYLPAPAGAAYRIFAGALTSAPVELAQLAEKLARVPLHGLAEAMRAHDKY